MAQAREVRKLLGGGMRQTGVLAAPALVALREQYEGLAADHVRATRLAEGMLSGPGVKLPYGMPETNIVFVRIEGGDAQAVAAAMEEAGVRAIPTAVDTLRFVTHYDVDDACVERAVTAFLAATA